LIVVFLFLFQLSTSKQPAPMLLPMMFPCKTTAKPAFDCSTPSSLLNTSIDHPLFSCLRQKSFYQPNQLPRMMIVVVLLLLNHHLGETDTKKVGLLRSFRSVPVTTKSPAKPKLCWFTSNANWVPFIAL
jgi:hypothetical protein